MPVTPSAKKALRNARAKTVRNAAFKLELKKLIKHVTPETLSQVVSKIDKAAKRDLMHPNKAARLKSRLAKIGDGTVAAKQVTKKKSATKKASTKAKAIKARAKK